MKWDWWSVAFVASVAFVVVAGVMTLSLLTGLLLLWTARQKQQENNIFVRGKIK